MFSENAKIKIEKAGGLVLRETCPEVVHYNHEKVKHILTNSMKAEHYLKSGLNAIDTSVAKLEDCIRFAAKPDLLVHTKKSSKRQKLLIMILPKLIKKENYRLVERDLTHKIHGILKARL